MSPVWGAFAIFGDADADLIECAVEDIGTVACGIHPALHHGGGGFLAFGYVFGGGLIFDAEGCQHLERGAIGWGIMCEIIAIDEILRFGAGNAAELPVFGERRQACFFAFGVHELDYFSLHCADIAADGRDGDFLPYRELRWVFDLRIGFYELCHADLVLGGDFPEAIAFGDGVCHIISSFHGFIFDSALYEMGWKFDNFIKAWENCGIF